MLQMLLNIFMLLKKWGDKEINFKPKITEESTLIKLLQIYWANS